MTRTPLPRFAALACLGLLQFGAKAADKEATGPAPLVDRVGFPSGYQDSFRVLRTVVKKDEHKVVTVYGNARAASVTNLAQTPYPYGSVIVMETATADENAPSKPVKVLGMHVMRREAKFGEAYLINRSGEWEYAEYKPDGSYITPPEKSSDCSACHRKAGAKRDFVFHGRFADDK